MYWGCAYYCNAYYCRAACLQQCWQRCSHTVSNSSCVCFLWKAAVPATVCFSCLSTVSRNSLRHCSAPLHTPQRLAVVRAAAAVFIARRLQQQPGTFGATLHLRCTHTARCMQRLLYEMLANCSHGWQRWQQNCALTAAVPRAAPAVYAACGMQHRLAGACNSCVHGCLQQWRAASCKVTSGKECLGSGFAAGCCGRRYPTIRKTRVQRCSLPCTLACIAVSSCSGLDT